MTFEEEFELLNDDIMRKHQEVREKYKNYRGLDSPGAQETKKINLELAERLNDLRKKYSK